MRIVVVGDVMLDVDLAGEATRLSPDAPVPVVDVAVEKRRAGGAGLVARMLAEKSWPVTLVTVLGEDDAGRQLADRLAGVRLVSGPSGARTPVKTRVRAGTHPVVRFDHGCARPPVPGVTPAMLSAVEDAAVVVVADYGRGLAANPQLRSLLARLTTEVPVIWDPHPAGPDPVQGVAVVTPNLEEATKAAAACGATAAVQDIGDPAIDAGHLAGLLRERWNSRAVLVTRGGDGAMLACDDGHAPQQIPAPHVETGDPCGAGDRLAAGLAVHLLAGRGLPEAARLAVHEAADFLAAGGVSALPEPPVRVGAVAPEDLAPHPVEPNPGDALLLARAVRNRGGTVVATGGCFDLLHAGHVRALAAARAMGDCLVVCLNSDASVRRLKGPDRPIIGEQDRTELLLALACVDAVMVFDEDTPEAVLDRLRPDLWVKGGDYQGARLPEADLVERWGGRCLTVPYHPARSTTGLATALAKVG